MNDYTIEGFNGLSKQQPVLALTATIFLLSLTGIPLTAGFTSKFYVIMAAIQNGHHMWLVIFAVLCAALSAYYYFKVIQAIYFKETGENTDYQMDISPVFKGLLIFIAALIIIFGIMPGLIIDWLYF
jgi:NADH-quinone oxidoreductase subunit N